MLVQLGTQHDAKRHSEAAFLSQRSTCSASNKVAKRQLNIELSSRFRSLEQSIPAKTIDMLASVHGKHAFAAHIHGACLCFQGIAAPAGAATLATCARMLVQLGIQA